ncbi:hypothetical protein ABTD78_19590, partial [Acinetobacter baumannii]
MFTSKATEAAGKPEKWRAWQNSVNTASYRPYSAAVWPTLPGKRQGNCKAKGLLMLPSALDQVPVM